MEFSAQQIAELVGGTVEGDAQRKVGTFAKSKRRVHMICLFWQISNTPIIYTPQKPA